LEGVAALKGYGAASSGARQPRFVFNPAGGQELLWDKY